MIEILITTIILWIWILTLHRTITQAKLVNERTFQTMIANQLATEWAEILYQIRNTNFLKYESAKEIDVENCIKTKKIKDWKLSSDNSAEACDRMKCYDLCLADFKKEHNINRCWLSIDYDTCISSNSNYTWILNTWFYYIVTNNWSNSINQCTWHDDFNDINSEDCLSNADECCHRYRNEYSICLNSWVRVPCTLWHEWDESKYWIFYRHIEWMWIYDMSASNITWWQLLATNQLGNYNAQEFRFCSTVSRAWWEHPAVEICSTMTNFIE